ncbi:MAG: hypothetical protein IPL78_14575 [Chloroflexi bacterium]|nr:hypothetical protein [Chloroflexota bacterium]
MRKLAFILLLGIVFLLVGCADDPVTPTVTAVAEVVETATRPQTATPIPSSTFTPPPTATQRRRRRIPLHPLPPRPPRQPHCLQPRLPPHLPQPPRLLPFYRPPRPDRHPCLPVAPLHLAQTYLLTPALRREPVTGNPELPTLMSVKFIFMVQVSTPILFTLGPVPP